MKGSFFIPISLMVMASVLASTPVPPAQGGQKQPRILGQKAVLHIYYYAPNTLEITHVDSYLLKDEDACESAIPAALEIAVPRAGDGDLVSASCVGMTPPAPITQPTERGVREGATEL